ncbi:YdhK family protein [Niallia sp. HCP3S3_B10]|uniref:YdhK family protein n=1 Tax=Niallia sp. HCP3S3_B10 TaxID=3438944 RepID=UPI003F8B6B80
MKKKTFMKSSLILTLLVLLLAACSNNNNDNSSNTSEEGMDMSSHDMEGMDMSGSGEVPEGLKVAENPKYEVGSNAIINADHMEGMDGAEATIVGAYDTIVYTISYTPTTGGEKVTNHKWVIQEEIEDAGDEAIEPGTEVIVNADHMEGMNGAKATIDSAEKTTVYMVDYTPTTGGEKVTNHQWITESELSPVE